MPFEYVYNLPEVEIEILTTNGTWQPSDFVFTLESNTGSVKSGTLFVKTGANSTNIIASVVNFNQSGSAVFEVCDPTTTKDSGLVSDLPSGDDTYANFGTAIRPTHTSLYVGGFESLRATSSGIRIGDTAGNPSALLHVYEDNTSGSGLLIQQVGSGDAKIRFTNSNTWSFGIDGSDTGKLKICSSDSLGTSTLISADTSNKLAIGSDSVLAFHSSSDLFPNSSPKLEVRTGSGSTAYTEGITLRHVDTGTSGTLFLLFKHKDESSSDNSNKMTGVESKVSGSSIRLNIINQGTTGISIASGQVNAVSSFVFESTTTFSGNSTFTTEMKGLSGSSFINSGVTLLSGATSTHDLTVNGVLSTPSGLNFSGAIDALNGVHTANDYGFSFSTSGNLVTAPGNPINTTVLLVQNIRTNLSDNFVGGYAAQAVSGLFVRTAPESGTSSLSGSVAISAQAIYDSNNETSFAGGDYPDYKAINFLARSPNAPTRSPLGTQSPIYSYGLYIESQDVGVVSGGWGIYQAGTGDRNYFAGDIDLAGDLSVSGTLNFGSDITVSGNLYVSGNQYLKPYTNTILEATADNQEWSIDLTNQDERVGCYWRVWSDASGGAGSTILSTRGDTLRVGVLTSNPTTDFDVSGSGLFRSNLEVSGTIEAGEALSIGQADISIPFTAARTYSSDDNNNVVDFIKFFRRTSGVTVLSGIGLSMQFYAQNSASEDTLSGSFETNFNTITNGDETSQIILKTISNGVENSGLTVGDKIDSAMPIQVNKFPSTTLSINDTTGTQHSFFIQALDANGFAVGASNIVRTENYPNARTFSWLPVAGASSYRVWASFNNNLASISIGGVYNVLFTGTNTSYVYPDVAPFYTGTKRIFSYHSGTITAGLVKTKDVIKNYIQGIDYSQTFQSSEILVSSTSWTTITYAEVQVRDETTLEENQFVRSTFNGRVDMSANNIVAFMRFYYEFRDSSYTLVTSGQTFLPPINAGGLLNGYYPITLDEIIPVTEPGYLKIYAQARKTDSSPSGTANIYGTIIIQKLN